MEDLVKKVEEKISELFDGVTVNVSETSFIEEIS